MSELQVRVAVSELQVRVAVSELQVLVAVSDLQVRVAASGAVRGPRCLTETQVTGRLVRLTHSLGALDTFAWCAGHIRLLRWTHSFGALDTFLTSGARRSEVGQSSAIQHACSTARRHRSYGACPA